MSRLYKEIKHPLFSNGEIPELSLFPSGGIIYELAHSTSSSTRMKQQKRILVPLDTTIWSSFFFSRLRGHLHCICFSLIISPIAFEKISYSVQSFKIYLSTKYFRLTHC